MPPLFPFNTPNSFLSGPFKPTPEPGFMARLGQDLSDLTLKQTLGLPLSGSLQFGAGAVKGLSFGLLDPGEGLQESLDEFGLPDTLTSAFDIAGEIGGSFVPFVASSQLARKFWTGASLASKLTRGAVTFGAPELARQALTQELDPRAGVRSLATGAAFALPLPRLLLAPAVAGVELGLGAEPLEAAVAGLAAGVFGSLEKPLRGGKHVEVPPKKPTFGPEPRPRGAPSTTGRGPTDVGSRVFAENGVSFPTSGPAPTHITPGLPPTQAAAQRPPRAVENVLKATMQVEPPIRPVASSFPPKAGAKTIVDQLGAVASKSSGGVAADAKTLAVEVENLAKRDVLGLSAELEKAIVDLGPNHPRTRTLAMGMAEQNGHFIPRGALPVNTALEMTGQKLGPRGIDTAIPGSGNPVEGRADFARLGREMEESTSFAAQKKGVALENRVHETTHHVRRKRGLGEDPTPGFIEGQVLKMEAELKTEDVLLTTPDSVIALYKDMMAKKGSKAAVLQLEANAGADGQFGKILGDSGKSEFRRIAESHARQLEWVKTETGAKQFRPEVRRRPKELDNLQALASDHGMEIETIGRFVKGARKGPTTAGREVIDSFQFKLSGQDVRKFKSIKQANLWLQSLENGAVEPLNIHELRALAHPRLTAVVSNMDGSVTLTQTAEGATPKAFRSLAEATAAVRQQPNLASVSREIGPLTPRGNPPLEGTGTIGSIAGEQSHPAATCGVPALSNSPRAKKFRAEREAKRDAQTTTLKDLLGR